MEIDCWYNGSVLFSLDAAAFGVSAAADALEGVASLVSVVKEAFESFEGSSIDVLYFFPSDGTTRTCC